MSLMLSGKTALVTAAGQGIGLSIAKLLVKEGARVFATDINEALLKKNYSEIQSKNSLTTLMLNVVDPESIATLKTQIGPVDILCNCAGFVHNGSILACDDSDWDFSMELNVKSMFMVTKAFLPMMLDKKSGAIVNISSVASSLKGVASRFVYGTSKAAVIGLTKAIAADYVADGIRVNAICPGTVDSPSLEERMRDTGDYEKARADFAKRQPMGRIGSAEEIAELALFLVSDKSSYITGQSYVIDGGWSN